MNNRFFLSPLATAAVLALGACGGGGGGGSTPPVAGDLSLSGTAVSSAAITSAPVTVKCASGTGTATTGTDGRYSVTITSGAAPCIVELTSGTSKLYSVVEAGSSSPATVNISPLTTLMTAQAAGSDPTAMFTTFDAAAQAKLSASALAAARTDLAAGLAGRVDLSGFDPIKTGITTGDANVLKLAQFDGALSAARLSLAELQAALLANPGIDAPIKTVLSPAASTCKSLRSATIRTVSLSGFETADVDAANLTVRYADGTQDTLTDSGGCRFANGTATVLVSPSSIAASRFPTVTGQFAAAFSFPVQSIPLGSLAGAWNYVIYGRDPSSAAPTVNTPGHGMFTLGANGTLTAAGLDCTGLNTCTIGGTSGVLTTNAQGGFNFGDVGDTTPNRVFAYRTASGATMLFQYVNDGDRTGLLVAAKQVKSPIPTVGTVTPYSNFSIGSSGFAGAITSDVSTVVSVDATSNGSFTRTTLDGHPETFLLNTPRDGMRHRAAGSSLATNGATVPINGIVQLRPLGAGVSLSVSMLATQNFFNFAIDGSTP